MKLSENRVAELTCRWGKPSTWSVKPKIVNALPAIVEPTHADIRQLRKTHHTAALRVILRAAA